MDHDAPELYLGVVTGTDVAVVLAEFVIIVGIVVAKYRSFGGVVVLEPIELPTRVVVVTDSEHLDPSTRDSTVQFERVVRGHPSF